METFADRAIAYYLGLKEPTNLPSGVGALNPYRQPEIQAIVKQFFTTYFSDNSPRVYILGINPGRFGAGVTGISFTTPQNLQKYCGIDNDLPPSPELSSRFIYQIVEAFGGAKAFYGQFFLTSLYPLALVKDGKNYNFYDDKATTATLWPAIANTVRTQLLFDQSGLEKNRRVAVCLGRKNEAFFQKLNQEHRFFDRIVTLDHPRYILQYRSRDIELYVDRYVRTLADCLS
ncbi:uracil-DNA glycosylase family protein [Larkinella humicola]|uniref:SMUG2 DNA glycosylase family protein n=1 Tax=Larkinella humicola TaxID=2607654 RepID=A0A5N1JED2_9BACT|nr:uracil-DNA glycosylase family protein [Larkinella humicola]KAA9349079.1 SMUG2 DNA glycosylase family protein [Larkinella humicola]